MNLFELFVKIGADTSEADKGIDETGKKTFGLGEKIKNGLATVGKAAVVGVTAAATAIGTIGTKAVQAYADYEQLVGGVETLFKDSQDKVMEYANNAYKTAGLSANEYMETVTSFSASLLQSLDGDTSAAAEKANLALTDMSDNANKMGSSMESKNQDALPFVHFIKGRASVFFDLKTMLQTVGYCAAHGGYGWTELDGA